MTQYIIPAKILGKHGGSRATLFTQLGLDFLLLIKRSITSSRIYDNFNRGKRPTKGWRADVVIAGSMPFEDPRWPDLLLFFVAYRLRKLTWNTVFNTVFSLTNLIVQFQFFCWRSTWVKRFLHRISLIKPNHCNIHPLSYNQSTYSNEEV